LCRALSQADTFRRRAAHDLIPLSPFHWQNRSQEDAQTWSAATKRRRPLAESFFATDPVVVIHQSTKDGNFLENTPFFLKPYTLGGLDWLGGELASGCAFLFVELIYECSVASALHYLFAAANQKSIELNLVVSPKYVLHRAAYFPRNIIFCGVWAHARWKDFVFDGELRELTCEEFHIAGLPGVAKRDAQVAQPDAARVAYSLPSFLVAV
jgi:hypothetical protein